MGIQHFNHLGICHIIHVRSFAHNDTIFLRKFMIIWKIPINLSCILLPLENNTTWSLTPTAVPDLTTVIENLSPAKLLLWWILYLSTTILCTTAVNMKHISSRLNFKRGWKYLKESLGKLTVRNLFHPNSIITCHIKLCTIDISDSVPKILKISQFPYPY